MIRVFTSSRRVSALLMVFLTLAAAGVRLWQFPHIPPAFNYDEAYNVLDSLWLWETKSWLVFLPGNTGRHALFHYLAIPFLKILGQNNIFALRYLSVVIGLALIPLMYRWVVTMFAQKPDRHVIGLFASTGLAFSFWHILISRSGFRASLLLFLYVLMAYLFWYGWHKKSIVAVVGTGVALGLSQYTYWLAGLLPLQFGLFAIIWTLLQRRNIEQNDNIPNYKQLWLWIGVMALASIIIFIPVGLFYLNTPLVLQYITQSSIVDRIANDPQTTWGSHLLTSLRIYFDGPVGLWQGSFQRIFSFDWLIFIGFWIGLIISIVRARQPAYLFLLTGLLVLWLPAPLNDIDFSDLRLPDMVPVNHAISNLRLAGILPIYYTLAAVGLFTGIGWMETRFIWTRKSTFAGVTTFALILIFSGGLNFYNFFIRWPQQPFLYERYNGPELELGQDLLQLSQHNDILMPFEIYTHPSVQFALGNSFVETDTPPAIDPSRPAILVTTLNIPRSTYVWLARRGNSQLAFLTAPQNIANLLQLGTNHLKSYEFAAPYFISVQTTTIPDLVSFQAQLGDWHIPNPVNYTWNDEIQLIGYEVSPDQARAGQPTQLTLFWQPLTDQPLTHDIFIHVINGAGEGVSQVDGVMIGDAQRWRKNKISPTQHTLHLGNDLAPGPYLIRLGLFNTRSGNRISMVDAGGEVLGDQVILGLFYVTDGDEPPVQPKTPVQARLGEHIELLGYTLPASQPMSTSGDTVVINLQTYWQTDQPIGTNYTIFVQLLDGDNQLVTGFDTQPLNGIYPTSLWQPGEVINQHINLTLPAATPPGNYRLVAGMYNFETGERLAATGNEEPLPDNAITIATVKLTPANELLFVSP